MGPEGRPHARGTHASAAVGRPGGGCAGRGRTDAVRGPHFGQPFPKGCHLRVTTFYRPAAERDQTLLNALTKPGTSLAGPIQFKCRI